MDYETVKFDFQNIGKVIELTGGRGDRGGGSKNTFLYQVFQKKKVKFNSNFISLIVWFGSTCSALTSEHTNGQKMFCLENEKGKVLFFWLNIFVSMYYFSITHSVGYSLLDPKQAILKSTYV